MTAQITLRIVKKATNLIPIDARISHLVIVMALTYLVGVIWGHRKYQ